MQTLKQVVEQVAGSRATVLVEGETGTGKELVARAIHDLSSRKNRSLINVNTAAIPATLLESDLFGHEKGSFTGADAQKIGRFELADGGTLFLDEIGDVPPELQPKLLRALQEHEFERVGGNRTIRVDVRLITATHRNLKQMVEDGRFREDLYYRLSGFSVRCPPLRERRDDIPDLVRYFGAIFARENHKAAKFILRADLDLLTARDWPGNVRQLQLFIEHEVILSLHDRLTISPESLASLDSAVAERRRLGFSPKEYDYFDALRSARGNQSAAGRILERKWGRAVSKQAVNDFLKNHPSLSEVLRSERLLPQRDPAEEDLVRESNNLVIPRRELVGRNVEQRPNFAFRILLVNPRGERTVTIGRSGGRYRLNVDLTGQHLGLYSLEGKAWLREHYRLREPAVRARLLNGSNATHKFLMDTGVTAEFHSWAVLTGGVGVPLRWSSGGALTVVTWRGKQWVAVFFRDIQPIGWNVANGASENSEQWRDLSPLSDREAGEELMALSEKPVPGLGVLQYQLEDEFEDSLLNPDQHFGKAHAKLRKQQDGVDVTLCEQGPILTRHAATPFSYEVRNGDDTFRKGNFVFSLNPLVLLCYKRTF